ncbi:hypothetical protein PENSPDRAFT_695548 [Peniophora sp. CONT]|nr:hypothetical protein PENSPDRAFT_695548 [Peniophora sp. CONT]
MPLTSVGRTATLPYRRCLNPGLVVNLQEVPGHGIIFATNVDMPTAKADPIFVSVNNLTKNSGIGTDCISDVS